MDSKKFGPKDSEESNRANLELVAQTLLDNIFNSVGQFPEYAVLPSGAAVRC